MCGIPTFNFRLARACGALGRFSVPADGRAGPENLNPPDVDQESMMTSVRTVLIVGGGTAGCALAALLGRAGVSVEIAERKPDFTTYGSGITLLGAALRVLRQLGVWDELRDHGYAFDSLGIRSADGRLLAELPDTRTGGHDLPSTLGAYRPKLAAVLAAAAVDAGAKVRLGTTVTSFETVTSPGGSDGAWEEVAVTFSDGDTGHYDLLVAADGIRSATRASMGIADVPIPAGMGIWRVHARRPADVQRTELVYDGPCYIAGFCPTGPDTLYAYLVEDARSTPPEGPAERLAAMRDLASSYHGPWDEIRADMTDGDLVNYTWFESLLVEGDWNRGRAVVIGDAAHACPPTMALGAAMALEDAAVLAELLLGRDRLDQDLFDTFVERRRPRVRAVVEASMQLVHWQLAHERNADVPGLMGRLNAMISQAA